MSMEMQPTPEFWEATNLDLFQFLETIKRQPNHIVRVTFDHKISEDEDPLMISAIYEGIHKSDDERWWLDATPIATSIVDQNKPPSFLSALVGNVKVGGKLITWEDIGESPVDEPLTMPAEQVRTSYWLGHVIAPTFMINPRI